MPHDHIRRKANLNRCLSLRSFCALMSCLLLLLSTSYDSAQGVHASPNRADTTAHTLIVNSTGDEADASVGDGRCATAAGVCTLRAAIAEANQEAGANTISFKLSGTSVQTIRLQTGLPPLSDTTGGTTIDGYSQSEAAFNTAALTSTAVLKIQITRASGSPPVLNALQIRSQANLIRGLAIYNVYRAIQLSGPNAQHNRIVGNFIGTDAAGNYRSARCATRCYANGVDLGDGASHNEIGGTALAERNVISGNPWNGIAMYDTGTSLNSIRNNLIGLSPNGTKRLANGRHGIDINSNAASNIIGGTGPRERNVISGNSLEGVEISHGTATTGNQVIGNFIGTDVTGNRAPSYTYNAEFGVHLEDGASQNLVAHNIIGGNKGGGIHIDGSLTVGNQVRDNRIGIGGNNSAIPNASWGIQLANGANQTFIGPGNVIAYHPVGVQLSDSAGDANRITANTIFDNTLLGIDLAPLDEVNPNDAGDTDDGPNTGLNFPVLTEATPTVVRGTACSSCMVEVFVADRGTGSHGQGKAMLGAVAASSDGSWALSVQGVANSALVTATATDTAGNTSEFAPNQAIIAPPTVTPNATITATVTDVGNPTPTGESTATATPTLEVTPGLSTTATNVVATATSTGEPTTTPLTTIPAEASPTATDTLTAHRLYLPLLITAP